MISIICVYNNHNAYEDYLLSSLKEQTVEFDLIGVDNTDGRFSSAAAALNYGASLAVGDLLMFVHQDICLESPTWLAKAEAIISKLVGVGAVGVAGRASGKTSNTASVDHGVPRKFVGNKTLIEPAIVQTLDECLIITPRDIFDKYRFDEVVCDNWHLYGVEYCLRLLKDQLQNYVLPLPTYHRSLGRRVSSTFEIFANLGSLPPGYLDTIKKIFIKHRCSFDQICTTCGNWRTGWPVFLQRLLYIPKDIARYCYWFWRQSLNKQKKND